MTNYLRPDENAAQSEIERAGKRNEMFKNVLKKGTMLGLGGASAALATKITPFLSDLIPTDLAVKGISKISPKFGEFLKKGISMGLDPKEGINYIKDNLLNEKKEANPKENKNIIQKYSPELFQYLTDQIQKGRSPIEAGALAELQNNFKNIIKKMAEDHKAPFSSILQTVFGAGDKSQQQQPMQQDSQQPQQGGISDDQLVSAFQNILKM
jgi:hypothetical protein